MASHGQAPAPEGKVQDIPPPLAIFRDPVHMLAAIDPLLALAALNPSAAVAAASNLLDLFSPAQNPAVALLAFQLGWEAASRRHRRAARPPEDGGDGEEELLPAALAGALVLALLGAGQPSNAWVAGAATGTGGWGGGRWVPPGGAPWPWNGWAGVPGAWPGALGMWPGALGMWPGAAGMWPVAPVLWPGAFGVWPGAAWVWPGAFWAWAGPWAGFR